MEGIKKFYVAHPRMTRPNEWAKETFEEAVAHASEIARKTGEQQYVVQIIATVQPQEIPVDVVVLDVKKRKTVRRKRK